MEDFTISLVCLFCNTKLRNDRTKEYKSGSLVCCHNCEAENDYDSLIEIAKNKGIEIAKTNVENEIKNIFKKFK